MEEKDTKKNTSQGKVEFRFAFATSLIQTHSFSRIQAKVKVKTRNKR